METKEEILEYIKTLAEQKTITRAELVSAYDSGSGIKTEAASANKIGIEEILYYIGGMIVFLGIAILIYQNWSTLGFGSRMLATLGGGVAAYITGVLFGRDKRTETVGSAFHLISALVLPMGLYVVFEHAGFDMNGYGVNTLSSGILLCMHLASYAVFRKNIFLVFCTVFGTWFFFAVTGFMYEGNPYFDNIGTLHKYQVLAAGLSYLALGHAFSTSERAPLSGFLNGFGIFGCLGSTLALGGWTPHQNIFWEQVYPLFIFVTLLLSVHMKIKSFLIWGTLFLMAYIVKITMEYFSKGLGWPLALVLAGLSVIGVTYVGITIKKQYLA